MVPYARVKCIYLHNIIVAGNTKPKILYKCLCTVVVFLRIFLYVLWRGRRENKLFSWPTTFPIGVAGVGGAIVQKMNRGCWALGIGLHWWIGKGVALRWMSIAKTRKSDRPEEAHYSFFSQLFHFTPYKHI